MKPFGGQLLMLLTLGLALSCSARDRISIPNYRVGETARVDVIAPFPIVAVDPEKTAELKAKEAARVPGIMRWDSNCSPAAVRAFNDLLFTERVRFTEALVSTFRRAALDEKTVNSPRFRNFVREFPTNALPITQPLVKYWATNGDDAAFPGGVPARFAELAGLNLRPDTLPVDWKNTWQYKLVSPDGTNALTTASADKIKSTVRRTNFVAISKARGDFVKQFSREHRPLATFAASLLQPNCLPEETLTRELRALRVQDLWSATKFDAGDTIVRAGEIVTPLTKAALDELRVRTLALQAQQPERRPVALYVGTGCAIASLLVAILWQTKRRHAAMLALQIAPPETVSDPALRAQIVARLTRLLGETFVKRLFADRKHLLEAQSKTAAETEQIEQRIDSIQSQVEQRYRAYEQRIAKLEVELAAAEDENRELIRAKIVLAKQELEAERAKSRVDWN
jgi:hypothetical protein